MLVYETHEAKRSGCAKNSAYISSSDRFSRTKVGSVMRVRSIPIRACDNMCMMILLFCATPSTMGGRGKGEREEEREKERGRESDSRRITVSLSINEG